MCNDEYSYLSRQFDMAKFPVYQICSIIWGVLESNVYSSSITICVMMICVRMTILV